MFRRIMDIRIQALAYKNSIVYAALQFYLRGDITYIEVLEIMVVSFANQQELIDKEVLKLYQEK